ncbi:hypothetical protein D2A34_09195 [Clostridium chromiireducens]|uniref:Uncharacterized protein n=1 Tax=Clostridium chromiireducens TaxID=225345 RepID=A0A399IRU3_9CLOT|nr:hypothetical protein D2A34_09195 [Clostridium chromiireducens]
MHIPYDIHVSQNHLFLHN